MDRLTYNTGSKSKRTARSRQVFAHEVLWEDNYVLMTIAHAYLPNLRVLSSPPPSLYDRTASPPPGGDLGDSMLNQGFLTLADGQA